ncbi:thioesterase family protein [uncultured Ruegeria sp.]|uniref:thioesterase family protein n=1 Tax=uncultured Ruegeria sp. TaxID=259304 RepID=UPI0026094CC4|nr:thioesterase family protein [uncultured Ruegeria sp.]
MTHGVASEIRQVPEAWIDYNGHMNLAYYVMAFDEALDVMLDEELGIGPSFVKACNAGPFALQNHVHYLGELLAGDEFLCRFLLLDADAKRLHIAGLMIKLKDQTTVCVMEQILMNVDHGTRRSAPYPADIQTRIAALAAEHKPIARPAQIGRPIGLMRR